MSSNVYIIQMLYNFHGNFAPPSPPPPPKKGKQPSPPQKREKIMGFYEVGERSLLRRGGCGSEKRLASFKKNALRLELVQRVFPFDSTDLVRSFVVCIWRLGEEVITMYRY